MLIRRRQSNALVALDDAEPAREAGPGPAMRNTPTFVLTAYERYSRALYGYIFRIVGSTPDAEDILQEAFARSLASCHTRADGDEGEALLYCRRWLFQVATNLSVDLLRRRKRQPWPLEPGNDESGELEGGPVAPALALATPGPALADHVAQQLLLAEAFRRLRPSDVSVLLLFEHAGFSLGEVAIIVGCGPAAAAKKVARARTRFVRIYQHLAREEVTS